MPSPRMAALLSGGSRIALSLDLAGTGAFPSSVTFTRASSATFVGANGLIQSASSGQARFGYDPVTLGALGYLSEEQRTNLILRSGDLNNAAWTASSTGTGAVSVVANSAVAPDGTTTAAKITINRSVNTDKAQVFQSFTGTVAVYAGSLYVKADTVGDVGKTITFSLSSSSALVGTTIVTLTAAWQRVFSIGTLDATPCLMTVGYREAGASSTGSVVFDAWGGQAELTSTNYPGPTSYIPTTSATVTRAADVASMTGTNFSSWYNQSAGTFVVQGRAGSDTNSLGWLWRAGADSTHYMAIEQSNAAYNAVGKRLTALNNDGGLNVTLPSGSDITPTASFKTAFAYATNDFGYAVDGLLAGTDGSGTLPSPTTLLIGTFDGTNAWFNGHIASIRYYNQRLPNAQLQSLTA